MFWSHRMIKGYWCFNPEGRELYGYWLFGICWYSHLGSAMHRARGVVISNYTTSDLGIKRLRQNSWQKGRKTSRWRLWTLRGKSKTGCLNGVFLVCRKEEFLESLLRFIFCLKRLIREQRRRSDIQLAFNASVDPTDLGCQHWLLQAMKKLYM